MNKKRLALLFIFVLLQISIINAQQIIYFDYSQVKKAFKCSIPIGQVYDGLNDYKVGFEHVTGILSYNPSITQFTIQYSGYDKAHLALSEIETALELKKSSELLLNGLVDSWGELMSTNLFNEINEVELNGNVNANNEVHGFYYRVDKQGLIEKVIINNNSSVTEFKTTFSKKGSNFLLTLIGIYRDGKPFVDFKIRYREDEDVYLPETYIFSAPNGRELLHLGLTCEID